MFYAFDRSLSSMLIRLLFSFRSIPHVFFQASQTPACDTLTPIYTDIPAPATPEDLATLDLYGLLSSMPKNVEVQHNPMDRDGTSSAGGGPGGKKLNAKKLAKAMTRKAILEKTRGHAHGKGSELEDSRGDSEVGDLEERESKKAKSDAGGANADGADDVIMDGP